MYACLYRLPPSSGDGELAEIAQAFSPRYQLHGADVVVIDTAGLERLLGPARVIGDELRKAVAARGIRAHVAMASTQTAAIVLAHTRPGLTVVAPGGEAAALAPTAIGILEKLGTPSTPSTPRKSDSSPSANSALSAFYRWGVRTLGELAALPDAELVSRFGRAAVAWQMLARGVDQRPLVPTLDEERFEAVMELEWPVEELEPLSFVLTRLLEPLCTRLERRDRGAAVMHVLLDLVNPAGEGAAHVRRLELPTPMRDVRALRTLALLDLESHPPGGAIDRVTIVIDPTPGRVLQHTLFTRAHPTPEQLSTLLARLGAVMGSDRVGTAVPVDTYRPGAFATAPFATEHDGAARKSEMRSLKTASVDQPGHSNHPDSGRSQTSDFTLQTSLRRCRQPVPARVAVGADSRPVRVTTDRRGYAGGAVVQCAGPWRTSGEWWLSDRRKPEVGSLKSASVDQPGHSNHPDSGRSQTSDFRLQTSSWDRDEWDVAVADGAVYRVFRDRATDGWFIDAIVD